MKFESKSAADASSFEVDSREHHVQTTTRSLRRIDGIRVGLTMLALLMGVTTLGISANTLNVYQTTHVGQDFMLPLWPDTFNLQPSVALVVGSAIVIATNIVSLLCTKVRSFRSRTAIHTPLTFAAPFIGLAAAIIAMAYFYAVNASNTDDTLLSWTCQWRSVPMTQQPHFDTLCRQSWAGLYLAILLIPVEFFVLLAAGWLLKAEKSAAGVPYSGKRSPSL